MSKQPQDLNERNTRGEYKFYAPSYSIWDQKYRLKTAAGAALEATVEDTWVRIARALAAPEKEENRETWCSEFYWALEGFKFIPAGRIIAGAGTGRKVTLQNCFVLGKIDDSIDGIFAVLREAAMTLQSGGGIGHDFSSLRPAGAYVEGVEATASGPLSFMDCWDSMCRTMLGAGTRRGAMMATLRCDHPDIEDFITAKRDPLKLRMFNLSVLVTDPFMEAVKADSEWDLHFAGQIYRKVRARDLWKKIMESTYAYAEPGVIFIDRINKLNNLYYCETIYSTNPCAEQPLPPYGACLLGSINLAALVVEPFTAQAHVNERLLSSTVYTAVRMMDNVIDVSKFPLPQQAEEQKNKRRIGLGVVGLADALIMCGKKYGSDESVKLTSIWLSLIESHAYMASAELAQEKGSFPLYDREKYLQGAHVRHLPHSLRELIREKGIRNSLLTSIAPTGTICNFAECISGGIEPLFDLSFTRKVLMPDGSREEIAIESYSVRKYRQWCKDNNVVILESQPIDDQLPEQFVTAQTLAPSDHLIIQSIVQRYVDSSISKTINLPEEISFEEFEQVYLDAYLMGCKSCTTYRPNNVTGSVLTPIKTSSSTANVDEEGDEIDEINMAEAEASILAQVAEAQAFKDLPEVAQKLISEAISRGMAPIDSYGLPVRAYMLPGHTYKVRWEANGGHAYYITINDIIEGGHRRPFEIFINSKNVENYAWTVALTRMISAVFRRGGDLSFVVEELRSVFDPRGACWIAGKLIPSLLAAIGNIIDEHIKAVCSGPAIDLTNTGMNSNLGQDPDLELLDGRSQPEPLDLPSWLTRTADLTTSLLKLDTKLKKTPESLLYVVCPKCQQLSLMHSEGCSHCDGCGYTTCG